FVSDALQQVSAKAHLIYKTIGTALRKLCRTSKFCDVSSASRSTISLEVERKTATSLYSNFEKAAPSPSEMMLVACPLEPVTTRSVSKSALELVTRKPAVTPQNSSK